MGQFPEPSLIPAQPYRQQLLWQDAGYMLVVTQYLGIENVRGRRKALSKDCSDTEQDWQHRVSTELT